MVAVLCALAAAVAGVVAGVLLSRSHQQSAIAPDPVVLKEFAAKREALKKEVVIEKLDKNDLVDALRGMSR